MSKNPTPWSLPDKTIERADEADREVRITDFTVMAIFPLRSVAVSGFPLNELLLVALLGLCVLRPARAGAKLPTAVVFLVSALLILLTLSGMANHVDWTRRVGHLGIMAGLIWAFGTGRISPRSAALGLGTGLIGAIGLALVGIGGNFYPGRLTGYLADPNAAAYFICVLGVLAIFSCDDRAKVRVAVTIPIVAGLVLTYSRTGLLAGIFAIVWLVFGRRLGQVAGAAFAGVLVWIVKTIPEDATSFGPFSNRSGSDNLRDRIIAQERVQLSDMAWYGHGPGTARVQIRDLEFFFHNSYLATRHEGGWPALLLVLALLLVTFFSLSFRANSGDLEAAAAQAAIIGIAVMAVTLGEVLLDTPVAIAVGFALAIGLKSEPDSPPDG